MERLTQPHTEEFGAEDPEPRSHLGTWPDRAAFGQWLAEDLGLVDYLTQVPQVIRPYVRLDYEALVGDICRTGGLAIVEDDDGIRVYEGPGA